MTDQPLADTTALVTGGSAGIGKAIAARLHSEGARVAICARTEGPLAAAVEEIDAGGTGRVIGLPTDCRDAGQLAKLYADVVDAFGPVNVLVNNVGTSNRGPFLDLTDDDWHNDFDLKLFSAIRLSRLMGKDLVERQQPGRIVNILAIGGKQPGAGSAPTAVTRAAGLALTKVLSKELAPHQILVNAVCIGLVKAEQHDAKWRAAGSPGTREEFYAELGSGVPLGRVGEPEEVAALVRLLVSAEGGYITGTAVNVDGGAASAL